MQDHDTSGGSSGSYASIVAVWLATGVGLGMVLPAPGTLAGLWGLALAAAVGLIAPVGAQVAVIVALAVVGALICDAAAQALGAEKDPGPIVLDEIVALPIVFVGVPEMGWLMLAVGYVLFRLCDIWKPGLARLAEELPGGLGIVADDCVAAVLACLLLHGAIWLDRWGSWGWLLTAPAA